MRAIVSGVVLLVAVVLVVAFLGSRRAGSVGPRSLDREVVHAEQRDELRPVIPAEGEPGTRARVLPPTARAEPAKAVAAAEPDQDESIEATIRGRFLFPNGAPAAGVKLSIHGWQANSERVREHGLPEDWVDPEGWSADDGTFSFSFDPPPAFQFTLDATLDGSAGVTWRWGELERREVVDVGDVLLARGGVIEGRVIGVDGEAVRNLRWMVYAMPPASSHRREKTASDPRQVIAPVDPETGRFALRDVAPGTIHLSAYGPATGWEPGPIVTVQPGETLDVDFVYDGADVSRRITVTMFGPRHVGIPDPDPSHVKLYGGADGPRLAKKIPGSSQSFAFDDLDPGSYLVEVDDPRFELWRRDGVASGSSVNARIRGSSSLRLDVYDAATNEPVALYALLLRRVKGGQWPNEFDLHDGAEPLHGGLVEGLRPGSYVLVVTAKGHPPTAVAIDDLAPGEQREIEVPLGISTVIEGRLSGDVGAVAGARVGLLLPAEVGDSVESPILALGVSSTNTTRSRKQVQGVVVDADGQYTFAVAEAGTYIVRAEQSGALQANSEVFTVASGESRRVSLSLPASGRMAGRLVAPEGKSVKGFRLWIRPDGCARLNDWGLWIFDEPITLAADGAFESGPLRAGPASLFLLPPRQFQRGFSEGGPPDFRPSGSIDLGRIEIPPGEVVQREISLVDRFPGTLRIHVVSQGTPLIGGHVVLNDSYLQLSAETDTTGSAAIPVMAGSWAVSVSAPDRTWTYAHSSPVTVDRGEDQVVTIDVGTSTATLTFMDSESGEPLRGVRIGSRLADSKSPFKSFAYAGTTDGEGRLTVTRIPGEYLFAPDPWADKAAPEVNVTWTTNGTELDEVWF